MRFSRFALIASFAASLALAACHDHHDEDNAPFDTFQACFDDHAKSEGFGPQEAIKICCLDHGIGTPPVGPNVVCGETQSACETYVNANLADPDATAADITTACAGYLTDRTM
jgi:hypothetical protein